MNRGAVARMRRHDQRAAERVDSIRHIGQPGTLPGGGDVEAHAVVGDVKAQSLRVAHQAHHENDLEATREKSKSDCFDLADKGNRINQIFHSAWPELVL